MGSCPVPAESVEFVHVGVGEIAVARAPQILVTAALGSCVGMALWDPFTQNGGLAHVMLPHETDAGNGGPTTRFANTAVHRLVEALEENGSPVRRLVAKIAGGASMFRADSAIASVGDRNVEAVRRELGVHRIPIRGEDVGGSHARTVELHLDSGTLVVRSYAFGVREL